MNQAEKISELVGRVNALENRSRDAEKATKNFHKDAVLKLYFTKYGMQGDYSTAASKLMEDGHGKELAKIMESSHKNFASKELDSHDKIAADMKELAKDYVPTPLPELRMLKYNLGPKVAEVEEKRIKRLGYNAVTRIREGQLPGGSSKTHVIYELWTDMPENDYMFFYFVDNTIREELYAVL
jgi:hypothetical protein